MNVNEYKHLIGKTGFIVFNELCIKVSILDVKNAYGKIRYRITPKEGSGQSWVDASRVELES
jgi:hypothetical protein